MKTKNKSSLMNISTRHSLSVNMNTIQYFL